MADKCQVSELHAERLKFKPVLPNVLKKGVASVKPVFGKATKSIADYDTVKSIFSHTYGMPVVSFQSGSNNAVAKKTVNIGVVLSGGQAPGGHNVIYGLFEGLKSANKKNKLFGFLGGPSGILDNKTMEINDKVINEYKNTGGFDMIQSGRTKIETPEQFAQAKATLLKNKMDALVFIGGDDSNTNAGLLAEYLKKENVPVNVIGVPKTIDGDLKNEHIEASFGFDTATKIYSELVGNICRDVNSARKYWHFIRLMGRSASHITLEVGFKTQPNMVLIGEEVLAKKMTLSDIINQITDVIVKRSEMKKNFGIILIPEGLIEFIPEMKELISALNDTLAEHEDHILTLKEIEEKRDFVLSKLPSKLSKLMESLPLDIACQLMLDRDPHGNVQVSLIETEKLLIEMVSEKLKELKKAGKFNGKFSSISHFFGYEGRCGMPSNFDANYTFALGYNAAALVLNGLSGYLSSVKNLTAKSQDWKCGGVPLTMMMNIERRKGKEKPVIQKALVKLEDRPFKEFAKQRDKWALNDCYMFPGPIQFFGPAGVTDITTKTLQYEQKKK